MREGYRDVDFYIDAETEKAVYCEVKSGDGHSVNRFVWVPKSVCEIKEFVQTVNAFDEPETYGKRVVAVAEWFARKNRF